jgi:hypothetical protein
VVGDRSYAAGLYEVEFGDYSPGRWAWILDDIQPLREPVRARGAPGLWDWYPPLEIQKAPLVL